MIGYRLPLLALMGHGLAGWMARLTRRTSWTMKVRCRSPRKRAVWMRACGVMGVARLERWRGAPRGAAEPFGVGAADQADAARSDGCHA